MSFLAPQNAPFELKLNACSVVQASSAAPGHHALASIAELQRVKRHYTLNIDGLAEVVGVRAFEEKLRGL